MNRGFGHGPWCSDCEFYHSPVTGCVRRFRVWTGERWDAEALDAECGATVHAISAAVAARIAARRAARTMLPPLAESDPAKAPATVTVTVFVAAEHYHTRKATRFAVTCSASIDAASREVGEGLVCGRLRGTNAPGPLEAAAREVLGFVDEVAERSSRVPT